VAKQIINTGISDNDRTGDTLRSAFTKINNNFTELFLGLPLLAVGPTPPTGTHYDGEQWWDSQDGNAYIWYQGAWVPNTTSVADQTKNVRSNSGNACNVDFQTDGVIIGQLTSDLTIAFSNFVLGARVKLIVPTVSTAYKVILGVTAQQSTNAKTFAQASLAPSCIILDYICTSTQLSGVYVSVQLA
jgi:hypothetical protein